MKVVITGARGYIGSVVSKILPEHDVIPLDIEDWDIRESRNVDSSVDVVLHLAAAVKVGESMRNPSLYQDTNVTGTKNVINAFPNAKIIFASTGAAFTPTSVYATTKLAAEDIVKQTQNYTIFRFFNVGGGIPTNPEGLYAATMNACKTGVMNIYGSDWNTPDGTPVRDYVHVNDIASALVTAVNTPASLTPYEPLGSGESITVKKYVDKFLEVNGNLFVVKCVDRRVGDAERSEVPFISKFMNVTHTLEDIVRI